jgi:ectoine hydroxylase-related dioxygenase (phytanoyl-CoA dioxygenase family)
MSTLNKTYREQGYVIFENLLPLSLMEGLRSIVDNLVDAAATLTASDEIYEILDDVNSDKPRIERIKSPHKVHPLFNDLIRCPEITNVLHALLGANVRLQNSKLNLKSQGGSAPVAWHQDWAFYPHTNDDVLAVGIMIDDMTEENGPVLFAPGTHRGPVYDHTANGYFCGAVDEKVAETLRPKAKVITGTAGTVTFHHARLLHASIANPSPHPRRLLLYEVMAADAWPLAGCSAFFESWDSMTERMVIGKQPSSPRLINVPVRMPQPEPSKQTSIFQLQRDSSGQNYVNDLNH